MDWVFLLLTRCFPYVDLINAVYKKWGKYLSFFLLFINVYLCLQFTIPEKLLTISKGKSPSVVGAKSLNRNFKSYKHIISHAG